MPDSVVRALPSPGAAIEAVPRVSAHRHRAIVLAVLLVLLAALTVLSLATGSRMLSPGDIVDALRHTYTTDANPADPRLNETAIVVQILRLPRTILALLVGAALAAAGALMQGHTRNPIADPGLLGITQGAAFAVVLAVYLGGLTRPVQFVWFSFLGAALAALVVFGLARAGGGSASPLTLVLAGSGVAVFLSAMTSAVALSNRQSLEALRFWSAGSVAGRGVGVIEVVAPFLIVGLALALASAPSVNLMNLGDDAARALGLRLGLARGAGILAVTLLAGASTAACGSIAFLGLMAPHIARFITGPDYRWLIPYAAVIGALLLLSADIAGRLLTRPGELEVGIVLALLGAPFFAVLVWWRKAVNL